MSFFLKTLSRNATASAKKNETFPGKVAKSVLPLLEKKGGEKSQIHGIDYFSELSKTTNKRKITLQRLSGLLGIFLLILQPGFGANGVAGQSAKENIRFIGLNVVEEADLLEKFRSLPVSLTFPEKLQRLLQQIHLSGYLEAQIDSVVAASGQPEIAVYVTEGRPYYLRTAAVLCPDSGVAKMTRETVSLWVGRRFNQPVLEAELQSILGRLNRRGYLLASVEVMKIGIDSTDAAVDLIIRVDPGKPSVLTRIEVPGEVDVRPAFIARLIGLKLHQPLSSDRVERIAGRLTRVPFLSLTGEPQIRFLKDSSAVLFLPLREENSSQVSGVLGYNPGNARQNGYLSGLLDLRFGNLFGTARELMSYWEKRDPYSQALRISYREPFVAGLPADLLVGFAQEIQDSTYIRRNWNISAEADLLEAVRVGVTAGREEVIPDSIGRYRFQLPPSSGWKLLVSFSLDSRDHPYNPRHGVLFANTVDLVRKKSGGLNGDRSQIREVRRLGFDFENYWAVFKRQTLRISLSGRLIRMEGTAIPLDELYRLGGANDLRGYREDQFMGDRLVWGSLEWRLLPENDTFIGAFLDVGYISRLLDGEQRNEWVKYGYGITLRTRTDLGIIGFDLAFGEKDSFAQGKVHIRLMNRF